MRDGGVLTEVDKTPLVEFSLVQKNWTDREPDKKLTVYQNLTFKVCKNEICTPL